MASKLSKIEVVALWFAVAGSAVALPKGAYDLWQTFMSAPSVVVSASTPLSLKYEPGNKMIVFSFGLVLHNEGTSSEKINNASAFFATAKDGSRKADFNLTHITMKSGDATIPIYLPLARDDYKSLLCEVAAPMTEDLSALFYERETRRVFGLNLKGGDGREYSVRFSFDMSKDLTNYLLATSGSAARKVQFIGSNL